MIWIIMATVAVSAAAIAALLFPVARWRADRQIAKILAETEK